jgi:cytoskeletal protein RodZ
MIEDIGQQLRQAREARSLTLEQVTQATHMRLRYLQALESGDLAAIPSTAQARGFLRAYADFLGLDSNILLGRLDGAAEAVSAAPPPPEVEGPLASQLGVDTQPPPGEILYETIFVELGRRLQRQRELLGLSLEDVTKHTHLRLHYLRSLECGDLDGLPSPVQGRGMLKNYATFLGLDPEPLLLRFAEGLQARLAQKQVEAAASSNASSRSSGEQALKRPSGLRRLLTGDLLIGAVLVILLSAFVIWGAIRVYTIRSNQEPASTAPSVAGLMAQTGTPAATPSPTVTLQALLDTPAPQSAPSGEESTPAAEGESPDAESPQGTSGAAGSTGIGTPPPASSGAVQVYITIRQRAWMRVTVDGEVQFDGRVIPGSAYQFGGEAQVEIQTGNGAGLQIFFNGQDLGPMGLFGQVIQRVFTPLGIETPTPTITPTGTVTPSPSPTAAGTPTLQQFITATP